MDEEAYSLLAYLAREAEPISEDKAASVLDTSRRKLSRAINALARREYIYEANHRVWDLTPEGCLFIGGYLSDVPTYTEQEAAINTYFQDFGITDHIQQERDNDDTKRPVHGGHPQKLRPSGGKPLQSDAFNAPWRGSSDPASNNRGRSKPGGSQQSRRGRPR